MRAFVVRLRAHWMRNLLAVLQVALAVAAVTAVLANVLPALRSEVVIRETVFEVRFGVRHETGFGYTSAFYADDIGYLMEHADSIEAASIADTDPYVIVRVGDERYVIAGLLRVSPAYERLMGLDMIAGSFFTADEMPDVTPSVAVISDQLAKILFGDVDVVGRTLNLRPSEEPSAMMGFLPSSAPLDLQFIQSQPGTDLTIVGVFRSRETQFSAVTPHLMIPAPKNQQPLRVPAVRQGDQAVSPPPELLAPPMFRMTYGELLVKPRPGMERQAEQEVITLLRDRLAGRPEAQRSSEFDIMVDPLIDQNQAIREGRLRQTVITGAIGLAALIVAGFAVFTTTLANLAQQVRTIGLARAIGATRAYVLREIVLEAALLAGIGGVLGVLVSYPLSRYVLTPLQFSIGEGGVEVIDVVAASFVGVLVAMGIGALAAVVPAWSVTRLAPAEAWREGRV